MASLEKTADPHIRSWHKHSTFDHSRTAASQVHEAPADGGVSERVRPRKDLVLGLFALIGVADEVGVANHEGE
jgi:hypothetical protein